MVMLGQVAYIPWMPPDRTIALVPAGHWWDAIVTPQVVGLAALQELHRANDHQPGPVIRDTQLTAPRLYFLVPTGTAASWDTPGTVALGLGAYIGVPGATTIEPPGPHWLAPPDPDAPGLLVNARTLRDLIHRLAANSAPAGDPA
jgi:hypothetical protein